MPVLGNKVSDQAEQSTVNPRANTIEMRILIELQVISLLLTEQLTRQYPGSFRDDPQQLRRDVADSIT